MSSPMTSPSTMRDQYVGSVDNRCCVCLTLRTGAILTGILNGLVNIAAFIAYVTSPTVQSSWSHPGAAVTNLDISYLVVFALQIVCDFILIWGAMKKIPNHLVPWLWANAAIIAVFLLPSTILIILLLIFGNLRASMNHNDFISSLSGLGVIGAIHMFSWLVVFQFRKNLMEEQHIMARMVASAPTPPNDELPPERQERAPSPPPAYDEVTKHRPLSSEVDGVIVAPGDVKVDIGNESPPEYATALAMSMTEHYSSPPPLDDIDIEQGVGAQATSILPKDEDISHHTASVDMTTKDRH